MDIPFSMRAELDSWNQGDGIELKPWIGCSGNYSLAVGYITVFWPEFKEVEGYILRKEISVDGIRELEQHEGSSRFYIEANLNNDYLHAIHYLGCPDISSDKLILLGNTLKKIYEAKLMAEFPNRPCTVDFHIPEDQNDLEDFQLSFWQKAHEIQNA